MNNKQIALGVTYSVMKNNQLTILQDGWHNKSDNFRFAYSREMVDTMAKAGVKHFFGEYNRFPDGIHIKDFQKGRISEQEFKAEMMNHWAQQPYEERERTIDSLTDFIKYTKYKGIEFHATEKYHPNAIAYEFLREMNISRDSTVADLVTKVELRMGAPEMQKGEYPQLLKETRQYLLGFDQKMKLESDKFTDLMKHDEALEINQRDREMAVNIRKEAGNERSVLMQGLLHGASRDGKNGNDLDEYYGGAAKILLSPTPEIHKLAMTEDKYLKFQEMPSAVIYTDDSFGRQVHVMRYDDSGYQFGGEVNGKPEPGKYRSVKESELTPENFGSFCPPSAGLFEKISNFFGRD